MPERATYEFARTAHADAKKKIQNLQGVWIGTVVFGTI